jgi:hypothetical protein
MTTVEYEQLDEHLEENPVLRWRFCMLKRAGYDEPSARELAARTEVDLHRAVDLLRAGCPASVALRILL